jgi:ubiquinone/menaquinone biosynthesis C-methylase UbiE
MMSPDAYKKFALNYDRWFGPRNRGLWEIGVKMHPLKEGMSVLDVGCGTGAQLELYRESGCRLYGIDVSPAMLEVAGDKLGEGADLHLGNASDMPYPDNSFDLVLSTLSLHEMPEEARTAVLKEIERVCKVEGRILLIDFHTGPVKRLKGWYTKIIIFTSEVIAGRAHYRAYRHFMSHNGLPALISSLGLAVEKVKIVGGGNFGVYLLRLD